MIFSKSNCILLIICLCCLFGWVVQPPILLQFAMRQDNWKQSWYYVNKVCYLQRLLMGVTPGLAEFYQWEFDTISYVFGSPSIGVHFETTLERKI